MSGAVYSGRMTSSPQAVRPQMEGYGVPESGDGLLDWSWAVERLEANRNFWVVTASADGRPHAMPVWGIWLAESDEFVFSCAPTARKARNLRANPGIVVTTEDTVEVVSVEGVAEEDNTSSMPDVVTRYGHKYEEEPDKIAQLIEFISDTCCFRVRPERAFGIIERPDEFGPRATKWVW